MTAGSEVQGMPGRCLLPLTQEQAAALLPLIQPGRVLLGRITRETYDGANAATCGRLMLEAGAVDEAAIPGMREAIREANNPKPAKRRKAKQASQEQ